MKYVKKFNEIKIEDVAKVGGKNASLGEMYSSLSKAGVKVPNGFATTSDAYWLLLEQNKLKEKIKSILSTLDIKDMKNLETRGKKIRKLILGSKLPITLKNEIKESYQVLSKAYGNKPIDVAVRSSGTAEDLPT